ncbi:MAG: DUF4145 domain-containing protein [Hyphomicrobiales bacterium]
MLSTRDYKDFGRWSIGSKSRAKTQPDFIPEKLRTAYKQACVIIELNPRASAVMARYCLQEMLRDFWDLPEVQEESLARTLEAAAGRLPRETLAAIDAVRGFGTIGEQLHEDVRMMVEATPQEAEMLIQLVETLFLDFYADRHQREIRAASIREQARMRAAQDTDNVTTLAAPHARVVSRAG